MATTSFFITKCGVDVDSNGNLIKNQTLTYNLPEETEPLGFGKSISPAACNKMIEGKAKKIYDEISKNIPKGTPKADVVQIVSAHFDKERVATSFGRESILRILSQKDCIGLQFINCVSVDDNGKEKETILFYGIMSDPAMPSRAIPIKNGNFKKPLIANPTDPFIDEEGVGDSLLSIMTQNGITVESIIGEDGGLNPETFIANYKNALLRIL